MSNGTKGWRIRRLAEGDDLSIIVLSTSHAVVPMCARLMVPNTNVVEKPGETEGRRLTSV